MSWSIRLVMRMRLGCMFTTTMSLYRICDEGGLNEKGVPEDTRPLEQRAYLIALLRSLKIDYPNTEIVGHCELSGVIKKCPCFSCQEYSDTSST